MVIFRTGGLAQYKQHSIVSRVPLLCFFDSIPFEWRKRGKSDVDALSCTTKPSDWNPLEAFRRGDTTLTGKSAAMPQTSCYRHNTFLHLSIALRGG